MPFIGQPFGALLLKVLRVISACPTVVSILQALIITLICVIIKENEPWVELCDNFSVNGELLSILSHKT